MAASSVAFTALFLAVHAVSVNDLDTKGRLAARLHHAARVGDEEEARILLKEGADPDVLTKRAPGISEGNSALIIATDGGHVGVVKALLDYGASLDLRSSRGDNTALYLAAARGQVDLVKTLIAAGAAVDRRGTGSGDGASSATPLAAAAEQGWADVVKLLIRAGASVNARDEPGRRTPLQAAILQGSSCYGDDAVFFSHHKRERRPGHDQVVSALLAAGPGLEMRTHAGETALLAAVSMGCLDIVEKLISAGADVNQPHSSPGGAQSVGEEGQTPLIAAAVYGDESIARALLAAGADVTKKDALGFTAMDFALGTCPTQDSKEECKARTAKKRKVAKLLRPPGADLKRLPTSAPETSRTSSPYWPILAATGLGLVFVVAMLKREAVIAYFAPDPEAEAEARWRGGRGRGRDRRGQGVNGGQGERGGRGRGERGRARAAPIERTDEPVWWMELSQFHSLLLEAAQKEQPSFIDHIFTLEIMRNPALLVNDGEAEDSYEHDSVAKWLLIPGQTKHPSYGSILDPAKVTILPDKRRQRDIRNWCEDKVVAMRLETEEQGEETSASAEPARRVVDHKVHVFVDHSNVTIGAAQAGKELDPAQLVEHVERGREVQERVVVGSHESERARPEWERLGYTVVADPRRGKEVFVDEALHAQLMRTVTRRFSPPHVIALVTGDGNANQGRTSFPDCVEAALKHDWQVELYAWRQSTNKVYSAMAEQYKEHFTLHHLDDMLC